VAHEQVRHEAAARGDKEAIEELTARLLI